MPALAPVMTTVWVMSAPHSCGDPSVAIQMYSTAGQDSCRFEHHCVDERLGKVAPQLALADIDNIPPEAVPVIVDFEAAVPRSRSVF
jgi:hypothetical protein